MLIGCGSPEQQREYLPRILSGEDYWCQGYSEPGSGSDLASLKLKATSDGDHYRLNGSKIWTSHAHYANKMFILVRTDDSGKPPGGHHDPAGYEYPRYSRRADSFCIRCA